MDVKIIFIGNFMIDAYDFKILEKIIDKTGITPYLNQMPL